MPGITAVTSNRRNCVLELFVNREGNFATKARGMNVFRGSVRDTSVVKSKCILYTCVFSISVASSIYYVLQEQHILTLLFVCYTKKT